MMNIRSLLVLFSAYSTIAFAQGTWTTKAQFGGGARFQGVAFSIGHKGYCGLGTGAGNVPQSDLWEYDPTTNAWTQKAPFAGGVRTGAIAFVVGGKAYVGTGRDGASVDKKDLWRYDPSLNTWTQRASLGGVERRGAVAFSIGNFGYVGTGQSGTTLLTDFWRYDPNADQWAQRTSYTGSARSGATGFALNGLGYLGTGQGAANVRLKDMRAFNPANNQWTQPADFGGTARSSAVGFTIGNFGYIGTGSASNGRQQDVWRYDAGINTWTAMTNAPTALFAGTVFTIGGFAYLATGFTQLTAIASVSEYTPQSTTALANTWTRKADLPNNLSVSAGFSIALKGYFGALGLKEFDPTTNTWVARASVPTNSLLAPTGFSIGTKGYMGTGAILGQESKSFWEFDPTTNVWTQKADFGGVGRFNAAGFSIGSKGYLGTGASNGSLPTDFWEYDPTINTWTQKASIPIGGRSSAVGFGIGAKGYIGTGKANGVLRRDFWEYDPTLNAWAQRADFGGTAREKAVGFSLGSKGYIGTGDDGSARNDFWEFDPIANIWTQRADLSGAQRIGASGFGIGSRGYIGDGTGSGGELIDFWEYEPGPVNCSANQVTITLNTDKFSAETSWEIRPSGSPNPVCNGSGYASSSTIDIACCLPNGCYDLRVFDSFGDGILSPGGYTLRDASNQRIVDNSGNGSAFTTLSQVTNGDGTPWSFCVPIGTDALVASSCDQTFSLSNVVVVQVQANPAVTAQLGVGDQTDDGYQICIFDPHGAFRRNVFLSFAAPGTAFPVGTANALKPTFFGLNFSQAPFPPTSRLLNVRVRSKVNGVFTQCGPACRLVLNPPICTTTKLTTTASPQISCGAQNVSVNGGQLFCDLVSGANRYRFQFAGPNNYLRNVLAPAAAVNSLGSRTLTLGVFQQQPLPCGVPLTVRVQASFDGGTTFCPFGQDCLISVAGCPAQLRSLEDDPTTTSLSIWPNPNDGQRLNIRLDGITAGIATVELTDAYGKLVRRETLNGLGDGMNTAFDLGGDIAEGLYFVTMTAGEETFTQRVMIVR